MTDHTPDALLAEFKEHFNAGEMDDVLDIFEAGAVRHFGDAGVIQGHAAIRAGLADDADRRARVDVAPALVLINDDLALIVERWAFAGHDGDEEVASTGHGILVVRRDRSGRWRVAIDFPLPEDLFALNPEASVGLPTG